MSDKKLLKLVSELKELSKEREVKFKENLITFF